MQAEMPWAKHVWWLFTVVIDETIPLGRFDVLARLKTRGVEGRQIVYPVHVLPPYRDTVTGRGLPTAERVVERGVHLPTWGGLTREQVKRVSDSLIESLSPTAVDQ
jgi:perosamine synthetase